MTVRPGHPIRVLFVVSVDWFFVSHRMTIASALREHGFDVEVAAQVTDSRKPIEDAGFKLHALAFERGSREPLSEARAIASVVATYRRVRPDVVHQVSIKPILYGTAAATLLGVPHIVNAVSGLGYSFIARAGESARERGIRAALKNAYRIALSQPRAHAIFQNDEDRRLLASPFSRTRTHMVRGSGVDIARFAPTPLPEGPPVVLVPARLLRDKGICEFVDAAATLRARGSPARFVLVGRLDSDNPAAVSAEAVRKWTEDGVVEWWGNLTPGEMPDCYRRASLVVLPSYREGLPLSLVEAGASGRACVTTDVPGCRDVVRDGENGWLVPARDPK
ncbi:MAG: glycosyltransferase family 4 protein, partial [Polyangiales bacterium]